MPKVIRTLSMGAGVQTSYLLLKYPERYNVVIHCDIANGDREHGEYSITYWILDNIIEPFCKKNNIRFEILTHKDGGVWQRAIDKKMIPMMHPRWCTQDHKIRLMQRFIRNELKANFPENVVHSDIGFSFDEVERLGNYNSKVKYIQEDYPLIDWKIKRQDCINWLNENHPIIMNGNKIDWKDGKSGCWFCPFWRKEKLLKLTDKQKQEMIDLENNTAYNIKWKVNRPFNEYLNMNLAKLDDFVEDEICSTGHCMT